MRKRTPALAGAAALAALATTAWLTIPTAAMAANRNATISAGGTVTGQSTCFIGATEGSARFNISDLTDLGVNTFRVWGGMSRWEMNDDDGVYGSPSIAALKANINLIPWTTWDAAFDSPPQGSDYLWAVNPATPQLAAQVTGRQIISALHSAGIRTILTLRMTDNNNLPPWGQQLNPPNTTAGQNEWFEHVVATAYWLNVRNNYQVDDYEVHNEPDNGSQGWNGTLTDYEDLVRQTHDALAWLYATYLPGRTFHLYAPVTTGGSSWPSSVMQTVGTSYFDSIDVHDYDSDIRSYVQKVHGWMDANGFSTAPLWLSEWATYTQGKYDQVAFSVANIVNNLIYGSQPGSNHVYGSEIFAMYDWLSGYTGRLENFDGLVQPDGTPRTAYYAMRLAIRGLQGCRDTFNTTASDSNLTVMTTRDSAGSIYLLVSNKSKNSYAVTADLSALKSSATGMQWQYDATHNDVVIANPVLSGGQTTFAVPATGAVLVKF